LNTETPQTTNDIATQATGASTIGKQGNSRTHNQTTITTAKSPEYHLGKGTITLKINSGEGRPEYTTRRNSVPASPPTATKQPGTTNTPRIILGRGEGHPLVLTDAAITPLVKMTSRETTRPEEKDGAGEIGVENRKDTRAWEKGVAQLRSNMHPTVIGI
jgi:hypothetical protein